MRHHVKQRTLGRKRSQKTALMRTLALSLIENGSIKTTEARAKELRPYVERLVTYGKRGTLAARRNAASKLGGRHTAALQKLFGELADEYKERDGGYTRITKTGETPAGRTEAIIEFV